MDKFLQALFVITCTAMALAVLALTLAMVLLVWRSV